MKTMEMKSKQARKNAFQAFVSRFRAAFLVVPLSVFCTGCVTHYYPSDSLGNHLNDIEKVYTRPGTNIRIDILYGCYDSGEGPCVPGAPSLTSAQINLVVQALDTLTVQQIEQSGVNTIQPIPNDPPGVTRHGSTLVVSVSASDTNIGNEILAAMGFPPQSGVSKNQKASDTPSVVITPNSGGPTSTTGLETNANVLSSKAPTSYVPILSQQGMQAMSKEYMLGQNKDQNKMPTLEDQIRPHGQFEIVTPDK